MNILTIDVGNTNIAICLFKKDKPIKFTKIDTDITKTILRKHLLIKNTKIHFKIIISSVVPSISEIIMILIALK